MSGTDKILAKIKDEAKGEVDSIIAEAEAKANETLDKAESQALAILAKSKDEANEAAAEKKRRMLSVADLDCRKNILASKQKVLDQAFTRAREKLNNLSSEAYFAFIEELVIQNAMGDEIICFSKADRESLPEGFVERLNSRLEADGKQGRLSCGEDADTGGGFFLRRGGMEINCTVPALIRQLRDERETQAAKILFG